MWRGPSPEAHSELAGGVRRMLAGSIGPEDWAACAELAGQSVDYRRFMETFDPDPPLPAGREAREADLAQHWLCGWKFGIGSGELADLAGLQGFARKRVRAYNDGVSAGRASLTDEERAERDLVNAVEEALEGAYRPENTTGR